MSVFFSHVFYTVLPTGKPPAQVPRITSSAHWTLQPLTGYRFTSVPFASCATGSHARPQGTIALFVVEGLDVQV